MDEEKKEERTSEDVKKPEEKPEEPKKESEEPKKENKKEKKDKYEKQIEKLEAEKKELEKKCAELKNEYLKAYADAENTKKRLKEEAIRDRKYASQNVVGELVQPIDMLKMIVNMPAPSPEVQNYVIGFQMITNQLVDILVREGLGPIKAEKGMAFDPKIMQAVETVDDESLEDDVIVRVNQAGYMYKDRILRPAMVVVNKKAAKPEETKAAPAEQAAPENEKKEDK